MNDKRLNATTSGALPKRIVQQPITPAVVDQPTTESVDPVKKKPVVATDHVSSTPIVPTADQKQVFGAQHAAAVVKELARSFDCTDERQLIRRLDVLTMLGDIAPSVPGGLQMLGVPFAHGLHLEAPWKPALPELVGVAPASVKAALVTAFGPLGDLIYGADAQGIRDRAAEIKTAATNVKQFRTDLGNATTLDALMDVAKSWRDTTLPTQCRNELMKAIMNQASGKDTKPFQVAAEWYQESTKRHPTHAADEIGRELFIVCLNKAGRVEDSIREAKRHVNAVASEHVFRPLASGARPGPEVNGEVLAGLGKAFKLIEEGLRKGTPLSDFMRAQINEELGVTANSTAPLDYAKAALDISTAYYEAGFRQDFEYYPGIVSVYNNYEKGDAARAEGLAPMVWQACERAGGKEASDYWCLSTQTELSLILNKNSDLLELLPRMLARADVSWMLSSSVAKMTTLCAARDAAGQDTRALHHVIDALSERIKQLDDHGAAKKAPGADAKALDAAFKKDTKAWIDQTVDALRAKLGARPAGDGVSAEDAKKAEITTKVLTSTADFRAMTSSHAVGGNVAYGGQIPDLTITRHSVRVVRELLQSWGLDKVTDFATFNNVANDKLNQILGLQDASGRRPLEDLHSAEHKVLDGYDKNRFPLAFTEVSGDSRTDLLAILALGIGDCRPTAYAKQLLFDVWQHDAVNQKMGAALAASTAGDDAGYRRNLADADRLQRVLLRTVTVLIEAPIQMEQMYHWKTDAEGRPLRDRNGEYQKVENHTFNILVELDEKGHVKEEVRAVDAFYQQLYPLDTLQLSASGLVNGGVWQHDTMGTKADDGKDLPFRMTPTQYSGALLKAFDVGSCDFRFCGQTIAPPTVASITKERPRLHGLAEQIAALPS
jgi:hypothetical protein